jgi:hypothetical protein
LRQGDSLTLLLFALIALQCAVQVGPSGGPPDTTPPTIVSTYPLANTTEFQDNHLIFEFSEYVDRRSVEESIFFSPALGSIEYDWSGREVEILIGEQLRANVTYVVTVGTDVVDLRNRNRMESSFSLAFSTGASIDSGSLAGKVFDAKPAGVTIFAYRLEGHSADTLDPSTTKPDYLTQSGTDGSFSLDFLAWGNYRLFAVRDQFKDLVYDPQIDQVGMASRDFLLSPDNRAIAGIQFRLTQEDTTSPFVLDAEALDSRTVRVRFSEPIADSSLHASRFSASDTVAGSPLSVDLVYYFFPNPSTVVLRTAEQDSQRTYRIQVENVVDTSGNTLKDPRHALFRGSAMPDTVPPAITSVNPRDSLRDVAYTAFIEIVFSKAVNQQSFERGFKLTDSLGNIVQGTFNWKSAALVRFFPTSPFQPLMWYKRTVKGDSLIDHSGNTLRDSTNKGSFQIIDSRKYGSIVGFVEDMMRGESGKIHVFAICISDKTVAPIESKLDTQGNFSFPHLTEGQYVLEAFRDKDGDGRYTFGKTYPYRPSERFAVYPDTIKVRARWPVEGVLVRLKEN